MDFWKEFSKTITGAADQTVKGAEKLSEIAKLKYKISSLNTKLEENYITLGRLRHAEGKGEKVATEMYNGIISQIDAITEQITDNEERLYDLMNFSYCPQCGARIKKTCKTCPKCGYNV